ncbi:cupin domain-containing protein [Silvibacterium acidisoli]|uniref:cupin domain-containing protein n=1 Tax=Acidobacteriaceae bacterium ZG23-2 TaxID=2883246 RepID=UPI00406C7715
MKSLIIAAAAALSLIATAQSPSQSIDKAEVIPAQTIQDQSATLTAKAKDKGSAIVNLGDYKAYTIKLSVLTASAHAEAHAHFDDVSFVQEGTVTLMTGGTIVGAHQIADGETAGTSIEGGTPLTLHPGDIVHVPAGTPHQFIVPKGTTYKAFVVKVPRN